MNTDIIKKTELADLPELIVDITGIVKSSNLDAFKSHALSVFESINTDLQTDEDFAEAEDTIKWCNSVETKLETAKTQALAQTESIEALFNAVDQLKEECRQKRLTLDKLVKTRKDSLRAELVTTAKTTIIQYIDALNYGHYIQPTIQAMIDFSAVIKGKKTFASCRESIARHMETLKIAANDANNGVTANMAYLDSQHAKHKFLFHDISTLALKNAEDFISTVEFRVNRHTEEQQRQAEQQREAIRREEQAKAEAAAKAEQDKARAEQARLKAELEAQRIKTEQAQRLAAQRLLEAAAAETVKAEPIQPIELSVTELEDALDTEITQQPAQPKTIDEFVEAGNFGDFSHIVWCFLDYYQTLKNEGLNPQHIINSFNNGN